MVIDLLNSALQLLLIGALIRLYEAHFPHTWLGELLIFAY